MIRAGQLRVECQVARAVWTTVKSDRGIGPAAGDIFIDRLANARFQLGQIPRQIDHDIALFPVHRIELDAKFSSSMVRLCAAVASHASHE